MLSVLGNAKDDLNSINAKEAKVASPKNTVLSGRAGILILADNTEVSFLTRYNSLCSAIILAGVKSLSIRD